MRLRSKRTERKTQEKIERLSGRGFRYFKKVRNWRSISWRRVERDRLIQQASSWKELSCQCWWWKVQKIFGEKHVWKRKTVIALKKDWVISQRWEIIFFSLKSGKMKLFRKIVEVFYWSLPPVLSRNVRSLLCYVISHNLSFFCWNLQFFLEGQPLYIRSRFLSPPLQRIPGSFRLRIAVPATALNLAQVWVRGKLADTTCTWPAVELTHHRGEEVSSLLHFFLPSFHRGGGVMPRIVRLRLLEQLPQFSSLPDHNAWLWSKYMVSAKDTNLNQARFYGPVHSFTTTGFMADGTASGREGPLYSSVHWVKGERFR